MSHSSPDPPLMRLHTPSPPGENLSLGTPDVLQEAIPLCQAIHGIVALAHSAHEAAEGIHLVLARDGTAILVNLCDRNLDRTVVLGLDDAIGGAAFARDVAGERENISAGWAGEKRMACSSSHLQIDNLATVVLHLDGERRGSGVGG